MGINPRAGGFEKGRGRVAKAVRIRIDHAGGTPLFNEVVMVHLDLVYRMALRMTGRQHEAEDALQETFLRAHRAFDRFDLRDHGAKAWLLKILHNVVITRRQQAGRRPTLLEDMDFDSFAAELENEPLRGWLTDNWIGTTLTTT